VKLCLTKVQPGCLALQPSIQDVLHENKLLLPGLDISFEWLDEGGASHRLCFDNVVIKQHLDVING